MQNCVGIACREEGCTYEYHPRICSLGRLLGRNPGKVELFTVEGCESIPAGVTLNNAPHLFSPELNKFQCVVRALQSHYSKHHPGVRPTYLYKEKVTNLHRVAHERSLQCARSARYRERKKRDRDYLVKRAIGIYKVNHPMDNDQGQVFTSISDVDFFPWVRRLKVMPKSSAMLVGDEPWVFENHFWRTVQESLSSGIHKRVHDAFDAIDEQFNSALKWKRKRDEDVNNVVVSVLYKCFCYQREMMKQQNIEMIIPCFVLGNLIECVRKVGLGYAGLLRRKEPYGVWESRCRSWWEGAERYAKQYADRHIGKEIESSSSILPPVEQVGKEALDSNEHETPGSTTEFTWMDNKYHRNGAGRAKSM